MGEVRKRVVLVTGAASGIGAAICRVLAGPDTAILVHTRTNRAGAESVADAVRAAGGEAELALGDLTDPTVAAPLIAHAVTRFGGFDVLVSNAGFADRTKFTELTDAAMMRSMEAIHGAFFRLTRAAIPHLITGRDPRIVAISSFVAHAFRTDLAVFPASAAAKAATEALVRALAIELAPSGVTVNTVIPGFIRKDAGTHAAFTPAQAAAQTGRIPLGRLGLPAEVADAVAFLVSPRAGYITGQALHVDGGLVIQG
jgi:NAD(P)-dependent dehydrogenase (short-subunit alcohol dehydrogenase family)